MRRAGTSRVELDASISVAIVASPSMEWGAWVRSVYKLTVDLGYVATHLCSISDRHLIRPSFFTSPFVSGWR